MRPLPRLTRGQEASVIMVVRQELWRRGDVSWKLDPTQLELYEDIKREPSKQWSTEGARKLGKSYAHGVIALETVIQNPGCQFNWAAITGKECRLTLLPILEELSEDAPAECKGRYHSQDQQWRMPNGAWIQLIGAETKEDCEKGRGPSSIGAIVDEAGFHRYLRYLVDSVLAPQMRRVKRVPGTFVGLTMLVSTTPYTPTHEFCEMADADELRGAYRKLTIWDSGWESREEIEAYIASEAAKKNLSVADFMKTTTFRREYLSERVVDEEVVVFPEYHHKRDTIVREHPRPIGFEQYVYKRVSCDLGGTTDKYGFLYGYVDFAAAKIVIEDETLLTKPPTSKVATEFKEHEERLWPDANPTRISRVLDDHTGRMVLDLWELHKLRTEKATKNDRDASINLIRTFLLSEKLVVHPRCIELRKQLLTATRNKRGNDFERTKDGHFDLCASLMYFVRDLSLVVNPYPPDFNVLTGREAPAHHPTVARAEALGGRPARGLKQLLLSGNKFVAAQHRRHR